MIFTVPKLHSNLYCPLCLKSLSRVWLFVTLWTITLQALLSMGFSQQEYWNGLPFQCPLCESQSASHSVSDSFQPHGPYSPWNSPGQNTGVGSLSLLQQIFPLQADCLSAEPQGKPKNTGVGSLSLLQWIFPTQESNWGLLYCRQILYQLSYQGMSFLVLLAGAGEGGGWEHPEDLGFHQSWWNTVMKSHVLLKCEIYGGVILSESIQQNTIINSGFDD